MQVFLQWISFSLNLHSVLKLEFAFNIKVSNSLKFITKIIKMNSHEIDFELIGDDMQIVEIELDPGEVVIAEAGAMN